MNHNQLINFLKKTYRDKNSQIVVIEGAQALKHAIRFKANILQIITCDINLLSMLLENIANDVTGRVMSVVDEVDEAVFTKLSPNPIRTKVLALAYRKQYSIDQINKNKPVIYLEDPRDLQNIGAVIRVAAAADSAAVITNSDLNIWNPAIIRGSAGLHFAVPVFNGLDLKKLKELTPLRRVVALDPKGKLFRDNLPPKNAVLVFGTERYGIQDKTLEICSSVVRLPMLIGVSSLNLATSVAATLYQL